MADDMTKARLIEQMRAGRSALDASIAESTPERMLARPAPDAWSLKDVLAHISSWDRHLLAWLDAAERGQRPDLPEPFGLPDAEVDRLNAANHAATRDRPLADVLAEYRASFGDLLARAESLPDDVLLTPGYFVWTGDRPLWFYFAANSFWHYAEHNDQIGALLGRDEPKT